MTFESQVFYFLWFFLKRTHLIYRQK